MELSQFLVLAKLQSIAEGEPRTATLDDGSKEWVYVYGQLRYSVRSYGFNPLIGEELVWESERLIWGMNFYGRVNEGIVPASQVYTFLRQAQRNIHQDRPYRGPDFFRAGAFTYVDKSHGVLDVFSGEETIYYRSEQVYRLVYHGGRMV